MKIDEFKAWLDGYSEAIHGAPNEQQWDRIKAQIGTLVDAVKLVPYDIRPIPCGQEPAIPYWPYIHPAPVIPYPVTCGTSFPWPYTATSGLS